MIRQIFTITANQVVISDSHPEGLYSVLTGYPKTIDSRNYGADSENPNGSEELALIVAQADFADLVKQLSLSSNRAMWTITLTRADGQQIARKTYGAFPDMTPPSKPEEPLEE